MNRNVDVDSILMSEVCHFILIRKQTCAYPVKPGFQQTLISIFFFLFLSKHNLPLLQKLQQIGVYHGNWQNRRFTMLVGDWILCVFSFSFCVCFVVLLWFLLWFDFVLLFLLLFIYLLFVLFWMSKFAPMMKCEKKISLVRRAPSSRRACASAPARVWCCHSQRIWINYK